MTVVSYLDPEQGSGNMQQVLTTENVITNQIQDNKYMSPVITNFVWIDNMTPKWK